MLDHLNGGEGYYLSEKMVRRLMTPLFDGIFYCHELGIVHRNLKPENLFLTHKDLECGDLKIANFGQSRFIKLDEMAVSIVGTPSYTAPEILKGEPYDFRCDYWSLGVILFFLLSGTLPFDHEDTFELFELIKRGKYNKRAESWSSVSRQAKNLI